MTVTCLAAAGLGVWLMAAPGALDAPAGASTSMHAIGPLAIAISLAATAPALRALRVLLLPCAAWLIVAAWLLAAPAETATASAISGVVLAALACATSRSDAARGGGWRAVLPLLRTPRSLDDG